MTLLYLIGKLEVTRDSNITLVAKRMASESIELVRGIGMYLRLVYHNRRTKVR